MAFDNNTFKFAPVEALFQRFYYPDLLQEIMAGRRPKPPAKNLSEVDIRQPSVKVRRVDEQAVTEHALGQPLTLSNAVSKRSAEIEIQVTDNINARSRSSHPATSAASDLRVFRNGSLVKLWPGNLFDKQSGCEQMVSKANEPRRAVCKATVSVVEGANNLTAYAFNHDNIKSSDATLTVMGGNSLKRKGTLHILAVGVSKYANREYNLNYTTDDAAALASQLKLQQEKLGQYESVNIKTLLNENAT